MQPAMYDSDAEESATEGLEGQRNAQLLEQQHQDILLSMIPGDKSKRSIRIYPASRPNSRQTDGTNGAEDRKIKEKASGVFVKMNVNLS